MLVALALILFSLIVFKVGLPCFKQAINAGPKSGPALSSTSSASPGASSAAASSAAAYVLPATAPSPVAALAQRLWDAFSSPQDSPAVLSQLAADNSGSPAPLGAGEYIPDPSLVSRSFGDLFSSYAWLNQTSTSLFLDDRTTALTFPPLFDVSRDEIGISVPPGNGGQEACLDRPGGTQCLTVVGSALYFNGQPLALPAELSAENILKLTVGALQTKWLVGAVTGLKSDEAGFVYFFDGQNFSPLITKNTSLRITPQYDRKGGGIYFGGLDNDFLILYSGYDGHAFYYHAGQLKDVSSFFGLRVTDSGFVARVFRADNSRGSVFYVCSESAGKPKLVKVWSRRPGELLGSLDFSTFLLRDRLQATFADCRLLDAGQTLSMALAIRTDQGRGTYIFNDRGFDNSERGEVISANLEQTGNIPSPVKHIVAAKIGTRELNTDNATDFKFYFSGQPDGGQGWQETTPDHWSPINNPTGEIYWRAVFDNQPGDADYSPWFNSLNDLEYKVDFTP